MFCFLVISIIWLVAETKNGWWKIETVVNPTNIDRFMSVEDFVYVCCKVMSI